MHRSTSTRLHSIALTAVRFREAAVLADVRLSEQTGPIGDIGKASWFSLKGGSSSSVALNSEGSLSALQLIRAPFIEQPFLSPICVIVDFTSLPPLGGGVIVTVVVAGVTSVGPVADVYSRKGTWCVLFSYVDDFCAG